MMAQAQHTPGPWFARKNTAGYYDISIGDADYSPSFATAHHNPYAQVDADALDANARLIAAAPEMLDALRQMVVNSKGDRKEYRDCHKKALAAIAKAEGRDQ